MKKNREFSCLPSAVEPEEYISRDIGSLHRREALPLLAVEGFIFVRAENARRERQDEGGGLCVIDQLDGIARVQPAASAMSE